MLLLRIAAILAVIAVGLGVVAWLLTGQRGYLALALRIGKVALLVIVALFALLAFERLFVI